MYRITANAAATNVKRRRRQHADPFEAIWSRPTSAPICSPPRWRSRPRRSSGSRSHSTSPPPKLRSVVVLKDVYDLSHEAIADELGITVAAAKVRLHRGRRKLRDVLYDEGAEAHAV